jgi:hypothetical protein
VEKLTTFERDVLEKALCGDHSELAALREQLVVAGVSERTMTGVGFFTTLIIPAGHPLTPRRLSLDITDVTAEVDGVQNGAGFVLFVKDGLLDCLEGFTYDEPWPDYVVRYSLNYRSEIRERLAEQLKR